MWMRVKEDGRWMQTAVLPSSLKQSPGSRLIESARHQGAEKTRLVVKDG